MKKLIAIAALMCGTAYAEFFTGNELLTRINSETAYDRGVAMGYVLGAHDAGRGVHHCSPETATGGQIRDMVKNYLEATPALRHLAADSLINYTLSKAWPCPKKSGGTAL